MSLLDGVHGPADLKRNVTPEEGLYQVVLAASSAFEIATSDCSRRFAGLLRGAGLPFTDALQEVGTHHWYYWEKELPNMWAAISPAPWSRSAKRPCGGTEMPIVGVSTSGAVML